METAIIFILIAVIVILLLYIKGMRKTIFYLRDRLDFLKAGNEANHKENP